MAQSTKLMSSVISIHVATPLSGTHGLSSRKRTSSCRSLNLSVCKQIVACQMTSENNQESTTILDRRSFAITTGAVVITSSMNTKEALAAKRKTVTEGENKPKDDPNISGVQKKVLASMKRKEAMKASLEKLKEKGKIDEESD